MEETADFVGGLILICNSGVGRAGHFGLKEIPEKWSLYMATDPEWIALSAIPHFDAFTLWRLREYEKRLPEYQVEIMNLSGLINLVAFWRKQGNRLIPQQLSKENPNLVALECDLARDLRVDIRAPIQDFTSSSDGSSVPRHASAIRCARPSFTI